VSNWQIIAPCPAQQHDAGGDLPAVSHERRDPGADLAGLSGAGRAAGHAVAGRAASQGKNNIDAWWISLSTFAVLVITLLLLTFMGDALRDALDPRKAQK
jgi:hypothetical protein